MKLSLMGVSVDLFRPPIKESLETLFASDSFLVWMFFYKIRFNSRVCFDMIKLCFGRTCIKGGYQSSQSMVSFLIQI